MFVLMISRSSSILEHLGSKTRSPGQISVKSCYHYIGHIFQAIIMNLAQNVCLDEFLGVVGWCEGAVYLSSPGRPTDIGLQLGKACYPCSG